MPKKTPPGAHTGRPDCMTCDIAVGAAGAQAFRAARDQARSRHPRYEPGSTPVADAACLAADRAEDNTFACWR